MFARQAAWIDPPSDEAVEVAGPAAEAGEATADADQEGQAQTLAT